MRVEVETVIRIAGIYIQAIVDDVGMISRSRRQRGAHEEPAGAPTFLIRCGGSAIKGSKLHS